MTQVICIEAKATLLVTVVASSLLVTVVASFYANMEKIYFNRNSWIKTLEDT